MLAQVYFSQFVIQLDQSGLEDLHRTMFRTEGLPTLQVSAKASLLQCDGFLWMEKLKAPPNTPDQGQEQVQTWSMMQLQTSRLPGRTLQTGDSTGTSALSGSKPRPCSTYARPGVVLHSRPEGGRRRTTGAVPRLANMTSAERRKTAQIVALLEQVSQQGTPRVL